VITGSQLYLTSELKLIDSKFSVMESKFDAKFAAIDTKFDAKFAAIDTKFAAMDTKFDAMDTKFAAIGATLNLIMKQLNEKDSMQEMNKRMLQLEIDKAVREQLQKKE
jgi:hypothetical protein